MLLQRVLPPKALIRICTLVPFQGQLPSPGIQITLDCLSNQRKSARCDIILQVVRSLCKVSSRASWLPSGLTYTSFYSHELTLSFLGQYLDTQDCPFLVEGHSAGHVSSPQCSVKACLPLLVVCHQYDGSRVAYR